MEYYLVRHGHVDTEHAIDPFALGLSAEGQTQAERIAERCAQWDVQFLVASTRVSDEETANAILDRSPELLRWDLEELEPVGIDDATVHPDMHPLRERWTPEQWDLAYDRTWARVTATMARIELFVETYAIERAVLVADEDILNLILLRWLGLDWHATSDVAFAFSYGATAKVSANDAGVHVEWLNHLA